MGGCDRLPGTSSSDLKRRGSGQSKILKAGTEEASFRQEHSDNLSVTATLLPATS